VSLCLLCECRQIRRGKQKWEKKTNLLIHRHATRILCCYGIDENGGEDYGRAGAVLEDAVDQVRDVGSCIRYSSSLIAIIRTGVNKDKIGFELRDLHKIRVSIVLGKGNRI
jgi:hypothetical protein